MVIWSRYYNYGNLKALSIIIVRGSVSWLFEIENSSNIIKDCWNAHRHWTCQNELTWVMMMMMTTIIDDELFRSKSEEAKTNVEENQP